MNEISWIKSFNETYKDIMEDAFLLDALSLYVINQGYFMKNERSDYFPQVFYRLCGYLSQHAMDLHDLQKRLEQDNRSKYSAT